MPRIVVVGSINMDLVVRSPRFPAPGETVLGGPFATFGGGKGANQALAATRLGAAAQFVGCVGRDPWGAELRAMLDREHIDVTHLIARGGEHTGVGVITLDASGENTIVVASGANAALSSRDVEAAREDIEQADALVLQLEVPQAANRRAVEIASAASVPVILNAAPAPAASSIAVDLLERIDLLIVNKHEAQALAGLSDESLSPPQIARHLNARCGRHVIITLGEQGAIYFDGRSLHTEAAHPVKAVDATGAGDAFVAAMTVAWCEAQEPGDALAFACAAGSLAASRMGAMPSLPDRDEVDALRRPRAR